MRPLLSTCVLLSGSLLFGSLLTGTAAAPAAGIGTILATPRDTTPESRIEADQGLDAAVAAALIGAISSQFDRTATGASATGRRAVAVKLDRIAVTADGVLQRAIAGSGRLRLGDGGQDWIPFRFTALYDTQRASVGEPVLAWGDAPGARGRIASTRLREGLAGEVEQRLQGEFAQQPVRVSLDSVRVFPIRAAGGRYLRMEGAGLADFGGEGRAAAGVHALYDMRAERWLQVRYELGASANRAAQGAGSQGIEAATAVAHR